MNPLLVVSVSYLNSTISTNTWLLWNGWPPTAIESFSMKVCAAPFYDSNDIKDDYRMVRASVLCSWSITIRCLGPWRRLIRTEVVAFWRRDPCARWPQFLSKLEPRPFGCKTVGSSKVTVDKYCHAHMYVLWCVPIQLLQFSDMEATCFKPTDDWFCCQTVIEWKMMHFSMDVPQH